MIPGKQSGQITQLVFPLGFMFPVRREADLKLSLKPQTQHQVILLISTLQQDRQDLISEAACCSESAPNRRLQAIMTLTREHEPMFMPPEFVHESLRRHLNLLLTCQQTITLVSNNKSILKPFSFQTIENMHVHTVTSES